MRELSNCPFCDATMRIDSNRDWHRLCGHHNERCIFADDDCLMMVPATDEQRELMVSDWNRRPVTTKPQAQAVHAAVAAIYFADSSDYLSALWSVVHALSPHLVDELQRNGNAVFERTRIQAEEGGRDAG